MVRILEIGLGQDAIALHLGVAREALILFQQLGGVAALAIVLAVASAGIHSARLIAATAAPAAGLSIVDQTKILTKGALHSPTRPGYSRPCSCTTPEAKPESSRRLSPNRLLSSGSAIGGRRRSASTLLAVIGPVPEPYLMAIRRKSKRKSINLDQAEE